MSDKPTTDQQQTNTKPTPKAKPKFYSIDDVPYERVSVERVLTGIHDLDYDIKGLELGITLVVANTNCVDCDTEFFNGTEWKKISEYVEGDKVLQYNPDGTAELVYPQKYHKTECDTLTVIRNHRGSINQCLSDGHNFVYKNKCTGNVEKIPFREIKNNISKIAYRGNVITAFEYNSFGTAELPAHIIALYLFLSDRSEFPKDLYNLSKNSFMAIYNMLFDDKYSVYRTRRKSNADFIQFVCTSLGHRASIKEKNGGYEVRAYQTEYTTLGANTTIEFEDYKTKDGYMYCFTVPSGMLVLRRGNAINITGNCGKSTLVQGFIGQAIEQGYKCWVFSGEHTERSFLQLLIHQNSQKKDYLPVVYKDTNIADWYVTEEQEKKVRKKFSGNLFIYSNQAPRDIESMIASMDESYRTQGTRFYVVDNLISIDNINSNVFQEQTRITEKLRQFALTRKVIIVLVAHQRKIAERGFRIDIQDVAGSQNIANKAYNVISQYRIDMLNEDNKEYGRFKADLAKNGFDIKDCDGVLEVLKTKGTRCGLVGLKYNVDTKTYSQAPKITATEADKIIKRVERQETTDDIFGDLEYVDDAEDGDLPF